MYTAFYGLREKPFALSPDPRFLYLASSHREALAHLLYGIEQGEGFISVTGEVGTGKTTLCRTLLERLDGDTELAFLFNPSRNPLELLQSICAEFGLPAEGLARRTLMHQLNGFLVEQRRAEKRVLLIIDEAQTLSEHTLEQVRLLSNLETSRDKLIQILLLGQPELDRKLDERGLRQLRQRISVRWKLEPLGPAETRAYVRHRLAVAAGEPKDLFSEAALREVHRRTGGIPRLVNQLCDRALLAGYAARAAQIGPRLVRAAAREIPDARLPREGGAASRRRRGAFFRPWMFVVLAGLLVGAALLAGLQVGRSGFSHSMIAALTRPDASVEAPSPAGPGDEALPSVAANARRDADRAAAREAEGRAAAARAATFAAGSESGSGILVIGPDGEVVSQDAGTGTGTGADSASASGARLAAGEATGLGPTVVELIGYVPEPLRRALVAEAATTRAEDARRVAASPAASAASVASEASEASATEGTGVGPAATNAAEGGDADAAARPNAGRTPAPVESALSPGLLPRLLANRSPARALADTSETLLGRFGRRVAALAGAPESPLALQETLESRGLMATPFDGGSLALLRRLDHPVALPLAASPERRAGAPPGAAEDAKRWVAITGFRGDRARVAGLVPDQIVTITVEELEAHWLETGILVWERFEPVPELLGQDDEGQGVLWLQRGLAELRFYDGAPSSRYDAATTEAVRRFQSDHGLVADGVAGPLTQIALYAGLTRYPVPRLSRAQGDDPDRSPDRFPTGPSPDPTRGGRG